MSFVFVFSFLVLLEDEQKIGLGVFDRTIFIPIFRSQFLLLVLVPRVKPGI